MEKIILELKKKAGAFRPGKDEAIAADRVICGRACDLKGALGYFTPSAFDLTVHGCSRGKIYKKTPPNEFVTRYYLDADSRLVAISNKEYIDHHRAVIDYEEDVTYAFEWSLPETGAHLESVTVCGYDSGLVTSCLAIETSVSRISFVHHELFEYDEEGVVRKVKAYVYYVHHGDDGGSWAASEVHIPNDWDFKTISDKLYADVKPYIEHDFTQAEAEQLMPFLTDKLGSAKPVSQKKTALPLSSQKPLRDSLAKAVSKKMTLDELILSFCKMLDSADRKDEALLFEVVSENKASKQLCSFRLVRQIPDGAGEFIQLELVIDIEAPEEYPLESEWFESSGNGTIYLDEFIDYIRGSSAFKDLRDHKAVDVKVRVYRT